MRYVLFTRGRPHYLKQTNDKHHRIQRPACSFDLKEQAFNHYTAAVNSLSIPGEICKIVGSLGALAGGGLMAVSFMSGNASAFALSGGIAAALVAAGAPIAALGSIATQTKRNTKLTELDAWLKKEGLSWNSCIFLRNANYEIFGCYYLLVDLLPWAIPRAVRHHPPLYFTTGVSVMAWQLAAKRRRGSADETRRRWRRLKKAVSRMNYEQMLEERLLQR